MRVWVNPRVRRSPLDWAGGRTLRFETGLHNVSLLQSQLSSNDDSCAQCFAEPVGKRQGGLCTSASHSTVTVKARFIYVAPRAVAAHAASAALSSQTRPTYSYTRQPKPTVTDFGL